VAAEELGGGMHDNVGTPGERLAQIRRRERVIDDHGMPASWAIAATFSRSTMIPPGLARLSTKIACSARHGLAEVLRVDRIDEMAGPAESLEGQPNWVSDPP